MSTRTTLRPYSVITNGAMTGNINGAATVLQSISGCSYSWVWTGTSPVGTASVQVSNQYSLNPNGTVNNPGSDWTTIELDVAGSPASTIAITGNSGSIFVDIDKIQAYAIRPVFTFTSGTGTLNVIISGKVA